MRKFFAALLILTACLPAFAEDAFVKQITIGRDRAGLTWYLTDYGSNYSTPYAVARKYYTSEAVKAETIELLVSRYSVPERKANSLYFTEYRYEYTSDGSQYAEVYRRHYDMLGNEILAFEFDNSSQARQKYFINVVKNTIQSKGIAYALGQLRK